MTETIKILIADDHPVIRKGLKDVLEESTPEFLVEEAQNGQQALAMMKKECYDVAVLDIDMPFLNGLDAARESKKLHINTKIIILTMYKDEHLFNQAIDAGAKGFVLKENTVTEIKNAIRSVLEGYYYFSPVISGFLMNRERKITEIQKETSNIEILTPAEKKILKLISESKTSKEIAGQLYVSVKTVEKHRLNICDKLNIHGPHALIKYAFKYRDEI